MGVVDRIKSGSQSSSGGGVVSRIYGQQQAMAMNGEDNPDKFAPVEDPAVAQANAMNAADNPDLFQGISPTYEQPQKDKVSIPALDFINNKLGGVVNGISDFGNRAAVSAMDALTLGQGKKRLQQDQGVVGDIFRNNASPSDTGVEKAADIVGTLYGSAAPIMGAYGTGGKLATGVLAKIAPNAPKLVQTLARGVGAGEAYGLAREGLDAAVGDQNKSVVDRLKGVATDAALFGAGDAALGVVGPLLAKGVKAAYGSLKGASNELLQAQPKLGGSLDRLGPTEPIKSSIPPSEVESAPAMKQNWFTNLFGNQGVGISPFGSSKRLGSKPVSTQDAIVNSGLSKDTNGIKDSLAAAGRAVYQNHVDALSPLKRVNDATYETAMDASRANNIANNIIGKDFVNLEGQRVGDGLETIMKKVPRGQDKSFMDYLIKRDALSRMKREERVYDESLGMTPERIKAENARYEKQFPGADKVAADWNNFNKNVREVLGVNEGLISPAQAAAMESARPNYTPMRRQFSKSEKPSRNFLQSSSGSAFSGQKAPIKSVSPTGSARNIVDPRRTTIEAVGAWTNAAFRNRAGQQIVKAIQENPEALKGVAEIVPETAEATQKSLKEVNDILQSDGVEGLLEKMNSEFDLAFKKGAQTGGKDNIVTFMMNGNPVKVKLFNPEIMKAVSGMSPQQSGLIIDVLSKFSNATKRGATGLLAPVFAVKGATMDLVQSAIQAKNPLQQAGYTVHAILSGIGDKLNIPGLKNIAEEYRLAGGEYSAALKGDRQLNKSISNLTRHPVLSPQGIAKGAVGLVKAPFKALEAVGNIAENAPRIAAYKGELNRLGGAKTPENVRQAMSAARESTVNFSRKGALSKEVESLIPYNNAAIQGTYRVMKAFKNNPVRTTAAVGALAVIPKLYEYAQFHNDPDYQKLPARERMRFLIVHKNDDGSFTKIPMDPAYNSLGELTIETLRKYADKDPAAFKDSMDALANAWLPPAVTGSLQGVTQGSGVQGSLEGAANATVGAPFVATIANKSFTGAPIESATVTDRSPKYRYDEKTSAISKKIGDVTGFSPMKTDYLLRAYGGDPARLLLPLTSQVGAGNVRNTLLKNFIVDPTFTNTLTNDFYGAKDKLNQAYRDNQEVGAPLPQWYDENLRKEISSQAKDSLSKQLTDLSNQKKIINTDIRMNAEQKSKNLKEIQSKMNDIYFNINAKLYEKGVPIR